MERWVGKVALVTGTSSGIGEAIAKSLVEKGVKVVGVARRKELLQNLAKQLSSCKGKFYPFPADVSKEEDILNVFKWTKENIGPVSILINNAGILRGSALSESETKNWIDQINVNLLAPCIASREAIKQMKESDIEGHIININSIGGHKILPFPNMNLYEGTKHALKAATETLRIELAQQKSKIKITSISPGGVNTETAVNEFKKMGAEFLKAFSQIQILEPEDLAEAIIYVLSTRRHVQIAKETLKLARALGTNNGFH